LHKPDYYQSRFFWQGDDEKKKYRLAKASVCSPNDQGGPGIHNLEVKNMTLVGKWLFNLLTEDETWQIIQKRKYFSWKALSQVPWKPGDSHSWARLMATNKYFLHLGTLSIKDGSKI
jgi:hypothetical protein